MIDSSKIIDVSINVIGKDLNPQHVTDITQCLPTSVRICGGKIYPSRNILAKNGLWCLTASAEGGINVKIDELLKKLSYRCSLKNIEGVESAFIDIFISYTSMSELNYSPVLELGCDQIKAIASLGLDIRTTVSV